MKTAGFAISSNRHRHEPQRPATTRLHIASFVTFVYFVVKAAFHEVGVAANHPTANINRAGAGILSPLTCWCENPFSHLQFGESLPPLNSLHGAI